MNTERAALYFRPAPRNEDEMMVAIFECIDRMFSIVRPRKLLYMAIDGVVRFSLATQALNSRFKNSFVLFNRPLVPK